MFVWTRVTIWVFALFALLVFEPNRSPATLKSANLSLTHDLGYWTEVWARWDSIWYLAIARHGYGASPWSPYTSAFFPLYPTGAGLLAYVFLKHYVLAGIVLSLAAALVAFSLLHQLAKERLGPAGADRTVLYLAIFPTALFLQAVYPQALLLALILAAFVFAERERWPAAWCLSGFAMLAGVTAAALFPALLLMAWRSPDRRRALGSVAIAPALFATFPIVLWQKTGDALGFLHAQSYWHQHVSPAGPFGGIWQALRLGAHGIAQLLTQQPAERTGAASGSDHGLLVSAINVQALGFLILFVALTVVAWRHFGAPYGLYAACSLAIPLSAPSSIYSLIGVSRLALTNFPLFLALATLGERSRAHTMIVGISSILLGLAVVQWALWGWVS